MTANPPESPVTPPAFKPAAELTDRELAERISTQLEHQDVLVHEIHQFLYEEVGPLMQRWSGFLGRPVADFVRARRGRYALPRSQRGAAGPAGQGGQSPT